MDKYGNIKKCIEYMKNDEISINEEDDPEVIAKNAEMELAKNALFISGYQVRVCDLMGENDTLTKINEKYEAAIIKAFTSLGGGESVNDIMELYNLVKRENLIKAD